MEDTVKIYTIPTCPHCAKAKEFLSEKGIAFTNYDVSQDKKALEEMVKISGSRSVPVISVCNEVMVGFEPNRLEQMMSCTLNRTTL